MSASLLKIVADFDTQLNAPVSIGDTTATLYTATDDDGVALPAGTWGFTIDNSSTSKEYIVATLSGTSLTGVQSISRQGAVTSGFARAHRRGAKVTVTDWVILKRILSNLDGTTGFNSAVKLGYDADPSLSSSDTESFATVRYVNGVAVAGASNASTTVKGIVEEATQTETDARTTTGGTGADLYVNPGTLRATKYSDPLASTGSANAYVLTVAPAITAYATGQVFSFIANFANTGSATLNVSGLGAKTIKKNDGATNLVAGDIASGQTVIVVYDGTNMQMVTPSGIPKISTTNAEVYAADSVGTDAYAVTLTPVPAAYTTGMVVYFKAGTANTGAATLNVNSLGAKTIKKFGGSADLNDNDIIVSQIVQVVYDGTNFQMLSPLANASTYSFGTVTDLSTTSIANNDVTVTTGFTPRLIKLHYFIQGHDRTSATNQYFGLKGIAVYNATTLITNTPVAGDPANGGSPLSGDNGNFNVAAAFVTHDANTTVAPAAGTSFATNSDILVTLTINSVSSTGFVIRRATAGAGGSTARAQIYYEAYP